MARRSPCSPQRTRSLRRGRKAETQQLSAALLLPACSQMSFPSGQDKQPHELESKASLQGAQGLRFQTQLAPLALGLPRPAGLRTHSGAGRVLTHPAPSPGHQPGHQTARWHFHSYMHQQDVLPQSTPHTSSRTGKGQPHPITVSPNQQHSLLSDPTHLGSINSSHQLAEQRADRGVKVQQGIPAPHRTPMPAGHRGRSPRDPTSPPPPGSSRPAERQRAPRGSWHSLFTQSRSQNRLEGASRIWFLRL